MNKNLFLKKICKFLINYTCTILLLFFYRATRKLRLDLCLQLRLFERDALELSSQFELWGEQLQHGEIPRSMKEAEVRHSTSVILDKKSEKNT